VLGNVLRLTNVSSDIQSIVVGFLLIVSVLVPTVARRVKEVVDRTQGGRHAPAGSVGGPGEAVHP
jgi:ribose/xylose/arabinose/galactoside ABC-type transport system permease subunit